MRNETAGWRSLVGTDLLLHPYLATRFSARWGRVILVALSVGLVRIFAPAVLLSPGWLAAVGVQAALGIVSWRRFASPKAPPPSWERLGRAGALLDLVFFLYAFVLTGGEPAFTPLLVPFLIRAAAEQPAERPYLAMCGAMLAGWLAALAVSRGLPEVVAVANLTRLSALVAVVAILLTFHRILDRTGSALGRRARLLAGVHQAAAQLDDGRPEATVVEEAVAVAASAAGASRALLVLADGEIALPRTVAYGPPAPNLTARVIAAALHDPGGDPRLRPEPGVHHHLTRFAVREADRLPEPLAGDGVVEAVVSGLGTAGRRFGVFCLFYDAPASRVETLMDLAQSAAEHLQLAVVNALSHARARGHAARIEAAYRASAALMGVSEVQEAARSVVEILKQTLEYDHVAIFQVAGDTLRCEAAAGYLSLPQELPVTQAVVGRVARTGQPAFVRRPEDDPDFVPVLPGVLSQIALPVKVEGKTAAVLSVESRARPLVEEDLRLLSPLAIQCGLAFENILLVNRIHEMAIRDSLTGLFNRRQFWIDLPAEVERGRRYGERFSLLVVDIDDLKGINDTFGHPAGDEVLKLFARIATQRLRASDRAYRLGGDEFAVLLPATTGEGAVHAADWLRIAVRAEGMAARDAPRPTVSCGIASFPVDADQPDRLVAAADRALYAAKVGGGDRVMLAGGTTTRGPQP